MNIANTKFLNVPFIAGAALITFLGGAGLIVLLLFTGNKESNSETLSSQIQSAVQSQVSSIDDSKHDDDRFELTIDSIDDLSQFPSYFSRSVVLGKFLSGANFQQVLSLLDESKQFSDIALRQSTQVEIFRRLASLDPELALSHTHEFLRTQRKLYQSVIFQEWSSTDVNSVVMYTEQNLQDLEWDRRMMILHSILDSGHALSEEVKRDIARRFDLETYFDSLGERARRLAMLENPKEHWNLLLGDSLNDHEQIDDLVMLAHAMIENNGFDDFRTLHQKLADRHLRNEVLTEVLLARGRTVGYESAFNDAVLLLDDTNRSIVFDVADRWFNQDAEATFKALSQLEDEGLRDDLFETTALYLADWKPRRAIELLESFPESIRGVVVYTALFNLSTEDPIETAENLSKITQYQESEEEVPKYAQDAPDRIHNVAHNLFSAWAEFDALAAFEWLLTDPIVAHIHDEMNFEIKEAVTADNAEALIEIALKQPEDASKEDLEGVILSRLASIDFDKAKDLLPKMREGPARVLGYVTIGAGFFSRDNDPEKSIEFGKQLPKSEQAEYYLQLAGHWAAHDSTETVANIDLLPSAEAQARAASALINWHNNWRQDLSDEQIEHLKSYLPEEAQGNNVKVIRSSSD